MTWTRAIEVAVDFTKVSGGADLTNFSFPISLTHTELRTVANGGLVTNTSGFDIAPFSDFGGLNMLKFDRVMYDGAAGTVVFWVKQATLSATVAGRVRVLYANSSITTDQQDKANAFISSAVTAKSGFGNGTTLDLTDHTGNFNLTNTSATAAAGLFGGAASFNGTSAFMEHVGAPVTTYPLTVVGLCKPSAAISANKDLVSLNERAAATAIGFGIRPRATDQVRAKAGGATDTATANNVLNTSAWHFAAAVFTSDTSRRLLVDGAAAVTGTAAASSTAVIDNLSVGCGITNSTPSAFFPGLINFYIVYNATMSDAWLTTLDAATRGIATFTTASSPMAANAAAAAANTAFVAANGGDSVWPAIYDRRLNVGVTSAKVETWDDAIGVSGGRTPGPQLVQATAGARPAFSGTQGSGSETITLTAASSQALASAADSRFQLAATTPLYYVAIYEATGTGPIFGGAADPTSSTTYPYALVQAAGSNHKGDFAPEGVTTGRVQPDSGVAFAGGVARVAMIGKSIPVTGNSGSDQTWRHFFGGRQVSTHHAVTAGTAGNQKLTVGRIGSTYGSGTLHWLSVTTQDPTRAQWMAILAFALAQFGALPDTATRNTLLCGGDSLEYGSHSSDPMTAAIGTGTTSPAYIMANTVSGSRGSLVTQALDVNDVHHYNHGVSGRNIGIIVQEWAREIAPNVDGTRAGPAILVVRGIGNFIQSTNATISQLRAKAIELLVLADALSVKLVWETEIDRGGGSNGSNGNATGWYTDNGWATPSANGIVATTFNADLRTALATYGHYLHDIEANSTFSINRAGTRACNDTTYFDDTVHLKDAGYSAYGISRKTFFDNNDAVLWSRTTGAATAAPFAGGLFSGSL
jgi:hypothetical protein